MEFNKIENYRKQNKISNAELAAKAKMTPNGLRRLIRDGSCTVQTLENISKALGLPMSYWWEEEDALLLNEKKPEYGLRIENEKLKDQMIARLEKDVERLEGEIDWLKQELIRSRDDCEPGKKKKAV